MSDPSSGQVGTPPLLSVAGLRAATGRGDAATTLVNGIDFAIDRGQCLVLLGESGSGKSITALSLMRLLPPGIQMTGGSIRLAGEELTSLPERQMRQRRGDRLAMIFQEPMTALNPVMTVGSQITEALRQHRHVGRRLAREKAITLLEQMELPDAGKRFGEYPHQFSGGMKQRAMIAMALACQPALLIADEPTTALDVTTQAQILGLLKRLQRERELTLLLITHDLGVAAQMADRIAVMRAGELVEQSDAASFFSHPKHPYSRALFQALPSAARRGKPLGKAGHDPAQPVSENLRHGEPLLQVDDLHVGYATRGGLLGGRGAGVEVVKGVSLELAAGQTLAVVGESGSGKTTLAKAILRLLPSRGEIRFDGRDVARLRGTEQRTWRRACQVVFQDPFASLNPRMTVRQIVSEGLVAQKIGTRKERSERVAKLLEQVGLEPSMANRYPHEFSGGQRQRISIARALAVSPRLLVLDEPTSALDLSVQAQILDLLNDLRQTTGLAYLFITHNLAVMAYFADRVAVMQKGRIVEQGSVEQITTQPRHAYTRQLLAAAPQVPLPAVLTA